MKKCFQITFRPDLQRFGTAILTDDMIALFRKRAYDIAGTFRSLPVWMFLTNFSGTTPGVTVNLDGQKISFSKSNPFQDYCKMYIKDMILDNGSPVSLIYEKPDNKEAKNRWEVGFAISDMGFQNISFVNSIATTKGLKIPGCVGG